MSANVLDAFRRWGYLQADLDPLGFLKKEPHPELDLDGADAALSRRYYCGTIGVEFMHIPDPSRRAWIQERMEGSPAGLDRPKILDLILRTEIFEEVLQRRFPGAKRFSLEGAAALVPLLDEILSRSSELGAQEVLIGMSHRGRLNVMVQIVGRTPEEIFTEFEDVDPESVLGGGDVKYHIGATGERRLASGAMLQVRLVSNPSHLEAVNPVALGRVRAKQTRFGEGGRKAVFPILIHGDAAFAAQGIVAETLNLADLEGYSVGGPIHIIVNNRIGFTASPAEMHSGRFSSDIARRLPVPIIHVNAEDPEAVVRAGRMALEYRYTFSSGALIDLIGFRRHGHSEIDDPTITHPLLYRAIRDHPPLWKIYAGRLGQDMERRADELRASYGAAQDRASRATEIPRLTSLPDYWGPYQATAKDGVWAVETGVRREEIAAVAEHLTRVPAGFTPHTKIKTLLERRRKMAEGTVPVDFAMAELLAFGTLLLQGVPVRLTGQDSRRGTFGQRNAVLIDVENGSELNQLEHVADGQARFEIRNSPLSEAAVLGFEYGYSRDAPETLVLWEAQFGDFSNGAQLVIDQFVTSGEDKWGLPSGVVLLLPHGYEGQGPEHSNARVERFLQLAAEENIVVANPTTAAQYFHLLRRHALGRVRKPLVVFTPKSLLRLAEAGSAIGELVSSRFQPVITERETRGIARVLVCSGKIAHELRRARTERKDSSVGIVTLEQLYPFPEDELRGAIESFGESRQITWVQEEPANMGALAAVLPRLHELAGDRRVLSVKRSASASPATGSARAHEIEQKTLINLAFETGRQT